MITLLSSLFLLLGIYILRLYLGFRNAIAAIRSHPGYRTLLKPVGAPTMVLPRIRGVIVAGTHVLDSKHDSFEEIGYDICSVVSAWPQACTSFLLADAAVIKEVTSSRARFPKPVADYKVVSFFGNNIVASEGQEWKKYRKISAPAFSDRNNLLVWNEAVRTVQTLIEDVWEDKDRIVLENFREISIQIALSIIGLAGFGYKISWKDNEVIPAGHQMTFKEALHLVISNIFLKALTPDWAYGLTEKSRKVGLAFQEWEIYMRDMIKARRTSEQRAERNDLLSNLLDANDDENLSSGGNKLDESELLGNIFIFLVAGHETSAHTLCFTFALLALYQDEQESLHAHIRGIIPEGRTPSYKDMPLLTRCLAVLYETLRMFPPVPLIPKESAEDTVLVTSNAAGEKVVPVEKGSPVLIHVAGLHFNPRYWKDPHRFNPARFLEDWPRDAFLAFNAGPRACLGRKFFETEGTAILAMLVYRYKIKLKEEPQYASETFEQKKARVLAYKPGITLTPLRVPLVFTRRASAKSSST